MEICKNCKESSCEDCPYYPNIVARQCEEQLKDLTKEVSNYHRRMKCLEQAVVESGEGYGKIFKRALELYIKGE